MTISALTLVNRVAQTLNDEAKKRWTLSELVGYLSEAQQAAVLLKPDINPITVTQPISSNSLQTLPADAYTLIDVTRNVNVNGNSIVYGGSVSPTERSALDQADPDWHILVEDDEQLPVNYVYDIRNSSVFYLTPVRNFTAQEHVEIIYSKIPSEIPIEGNANIELDSIYVPALMQYMFHRAYMKEVPVVGQDPVRAEMHFQIFTRMITGESEVNEKELTVRHELSEMEKR